MAYKVYKGNTLVQTVSSLSTLVTGLDPGTSYSFQVSESDGSDESLKSSFIQVATLGKITIPTTKTIVSVKYSTDSLGIESLGLGNGTTFGGTIPINVPLISNTLSGTTRVLEVPSIYHMSNQPAILVDINTYLIIDKNKSMEIIVK